VITLSPTWFVCLYLLLFLAVILALWVSFEWFWRRERRRDRHRVCQCNFCGARFDEEKIAGLLSSSGAHGARPGAGRVEPVACPACGALQEWRPSVRRT
jgi:hypothetical protein